MAWSAAALCLFVLGSTSCSATDIWTDVCPGVRWLHRVTSTPWNINALIIDLTDPHVRIGALLKHDLNAPELSGETTSSMASRHGAAAAINGDYFEFTGSSSYLPQGMCVSDGLNFSAAGFVPGRISWVLNGATLMSDIGIYATTYPFTPPSWISEAVSGGPRTVRNGVISIETTPGLPNPNTRDPRTQIGITADGQHLILAVVDGRQPGFSVGMTATELGSFMIEMGAWNALELDSGGSSTFYLNGSVRNRPSDGSERAIANCLAVWNTFDPGPNPTVTIGTGFENPPCIPGPLGGQDGWTASGPSTVVENTNVHSGSQAVQVGADTADKVFSTSTSPVQWIDFWAKRAGGFGYGLLSFGTSPSSVFAKAGFGSDGNVGYYIGNGIGKLYWQPVTPYTLNQWRHFSVRLDFTPGINKAEIYIDGRQVVVGCTPRDNSAASTLNWIRLENSGSGTMIIDDLYVGSVPFDFPRVEPNTGTIPLAGYLGFVLKNASSVSSWSITGELNAANQPAPAGSIATINPSGIAQAKALGSFVVSATDNLGKQATSARITVAPSATISSVRVLATGSPVTIGDAVVTAAFNGYIYVEQQDRASGIRVQTAQQVSVGNHVSVIGTLQTQNGELVVNASTVIPGVSGAPLVPLTMGTREVTGQWHAGTSSGLLPAGLLARVCGKVTRIESDRFYVNDGGTAGDGIPVLWPGLAANMLGKFVTVTGPIGAYLETTGYVPALSPRGLPDITQQN